MPATHLLTQPCTIIHRAASGQIDDYGDPVQTETPEETRCYLEQRQRQEPANAGEVSTTMWLLVLPPGTNIDTSDAVVVSGDEYELVGEPWNVRNPRTGQQGQVEATLKRVAGGDGGAS
jgi:hypothetical protein